MEHVFLSYSRNDTDIMRRVRDHLLDEGIVVWTDETLVPGTPSWMDAIEDAIERADALVVLLTPNAKKSRWVKKEEMRYAEMQEKRIFPLLARGTEKTSIPFGFITAQHLDIRTEAVFERGMVELIWAMKIYLGLNTLADPDFYDQEPAVWEPAEAMEAEDIVTDERPDYVEDVDADAVPFDPEALAAVLVPPAPRDGLMGLGGAVQHGIVDDVFDLLDHLDEVEVDETEAERVFDPDHLEVVARQIRTGGVDLEQWFGHGSDDVS